MVPRPCDFPGTKMSIQNSHEQPDLDSIGRPLYTTWCRNLRHMHVSSRPGSNENSERRSFQLTREVEGIPSTDRLSIRRNFV